MPKQTDNRHNVIYPGETTPRPGISVLVREGFVVGHYDRLKIPAWVAVNWTKADFNRLSFVKFGRDFTKDTELPPFARAGTSYNFSTSDMERGHMARHEDNEAWGEDNSDTGCQMSNVVPQHKDMNGEAWLDLEELHQDVVVDTLVGITKVWIISGPIIEDTDGDGEEDPQSFVGNNVAVPQSTYKVIGWFDKNKKFHARGYIVKQSDRVRNNPAHYLKAIDDIEIATGLDFFPDLPETRANEIESIAHTNLWGAKNNGGSGRATEKEPPRKNAKPSKVKVWWLPNSTRYHTMGCRYVQKTTKKGGAINEAEKLGLTPCKVCRPGG